jgi:hypothetical protein
MVDAGKLRMRKRRVTVSVFHGFSALSLVSKLRTFREPPHPDVGTDIGLETAVILTN